MVRVTGIALAAAVIGIVGVTEASAQAPRGSYRRTCTNIDMDGPILQADCQDVRGNYRPTRIDLRRCGGGGVANANGRLTCGGGGGGGGGYNRPRDYDDDRGPPPGPPPGGGYDPYGRPPPPRY